MHRWYIHKTIYFTVGRFLVMIRSLKHNKKGIMVTKLVIDKPIKPTVGKLAVDLLSRHRDAVSAVDQMQESLTEFEWNVWECVSRSKKDFPGDFYVVVLTKKERLLENVIRNYFYARLSCPTPDWDQTVYKYKHKGNELKFAWTIPSKQACEYVTLNYNTLPKEQAQLISYIFAFNDGTLEKVAKELNGEKSDSSLIEDFKFKG